MTRESGSVPFVVSRGEKFSLTHYHMAKGLKGSKIEFLEFFSWFFISACTISIAAIVLLADSKFLNPRP